MGIHWSHIAPLNVVAFHPCITDIFRTYIGHTCISFLNMVTFHRWITGVHIHMQCSFHYGYFSSLYHWYTLDTPLAPSICHWYILVTHWTHMHWTHIGHFCVVTFRHCISDILWTNIGLTCIASLTYIGHTLGTHALRFSVCLLFVIVSLTYFEHTLDTHALVTFRHCITGIHWTHLGHSCNGYFSSLYHWCTIIISLVTTHWTYHFFTGNHSLDNLWALSLCPW